MSIGLAWAGESLRLMKAPYGFLQSASRELIAVFAYVPGENASC